MIRAVVFYAALVSSAGCFHHQAYLPGVIDMRTDGSGLPAARAAATSNPKLARAGVEALAQGAGVARVDSEITVEDRHYWIFGSVPIHNDNPTPELVAARDVGGALTGVQIGEALDVIDVLASIAVPLVLPVTAWVLPSHTFHARGRAATWRTAPADERVAPEQP